MSKPVKVLAATFLVSAAVTLAIVLPGGRAVAAVTKPATCPDNSTGIKYAGWTVVCTGQAALGATVTIGPVDMDGLPVAVKTPGSVPFVGANASFDKKKASGQIILTSQGTGSQAYITVTATPPHGSPHGASVSRPLTGAVTKPRKYLLAFRP